MSNAPEYNDEQQRYRLAYTHGLAARFGHKQSLQWITEVDEAVDDEILLGIYEGASLLPPRLGENVFEPPPATPCHATAAPPGRGRRGSRERHRRRMASEPTSANKEARFQRDVQLAEVVRQVRIMREAQPTVFANPAIAKAFGDAVKTVTDVFNEGQR